MTHQLATKLLIFPKNSKAPLSLREQSHVNVIISMFCIFHILHATLFLHKKLLSFFSFSLFSRVWILQNPTRNLFAFLG